MVYELPKAPQIGVPLKFHWYQIGPVPVAPTEKVTGWPQDEADCGWASMATPVQVCPTWIRNHWTLKAPAFAAGCVKRVAPSLTVNERLALEPELEPRRMSGKSATGRLRLPSSGGLGRLLARLTSEMARKYRPGLRIRESVDWLETGAVELSLPADAIALKFES